MSIIVMNDNGLEDITAKMDGAMHNLTLDDSDIVVGGIGNEFALSYSASSLNVSIGKGLAIIGGRYFFVDEATPFSLSANSTSLLKCKIDLSQPAGSEGSFSTGGAVAKSDLNDTGTVREMALFSVTTNSTGVSGVVEMRNIKSNLGVTQSSVDNLQTEITNIQNSLGDQATYVLDGTKLTIVLK